MNKFTCYFCNLPVGFLHNKLVYQHISCPNCYSSYEFVYDYVRNEIINLQNIIINIQNNLQIWIHVNSKSSQLMTSTIKQNTTDLYCILYFPTHELLQLNPKLIKSKILKLIPFI